MKFAISRLSAQVARIRHNALHVWTTRLVAQSAGLTIITPAVQRMTQSPHGDAGHWGAYTEEVSTLNRNTLNQAPGLAVQMLEYKAKEAAIRCDVIADPAPPIALGRDAVVAGKKVRKVRREVRKRLEPTRLAG